MNATKTKTETSISMNTKAKEATEVKDEVKQEVKDTAKKAVVPEVTAVKAAAPVKKEKSIDDMTDEEIEAYMKKRRAEKDSFTIVNEDVPMNKLINASVPPAPQINKDELIRNLQMRQNFLEKKLAGK